jgi:hypothetical protein
MLEVVVLAVTLPTFLVAFHLQEQEQVLEHQ